MENELKILFEIEQMPGIFLERESISLLSAFLNGYIIGLSNHNPKPNQILEGFQKYIAKKYKIRTNHSWSQIILFMEQDERRAFWKFYELFYDFLKDHHFETFQNNKKTSKTKDPSR